MAKRKQHTRKHPRLVRRAKHHSKHKLVMIREDGVIAPDATANAETAYTKAEVIAMPERKWRILAAKHLGILGESDDSEG